ncbi:hypothetical protein F5146DRAFT_161930 [Armillaria mellea]|nr:hypothetical protein F5146DRAFT_161930 [Armillaria mellea]
MPTSFSSPRFTLTHLSLPPRSYPMVSAMPRAVGSFVQSHFSWRLHPLPVRQCCQYTIGFTLCARLRESWMSLVPLDPDNDDRTNTFPLDLCSTIICSSDTSQRGLAQDFNSPLVLGFEVGLPYILDKSTTAFSSCSPGSTKIHLWARHHYPELLGCLRWPSNPYFIDFPFAPSACSSHGLRFMVEFISINWDYALDCIYQLDVASQVLTDLLAKHVSVAHAAYLKNQCLQLIGNHSFVKRHQFQFIREYVAGVFAIVCSTLAVHGLKDTDGTVVYKDVATPVQLSGSPRNAGVNFVIWCKAMEATSTFSANRLYGQTLSICFVHCSLKSSGRKRQYPICDSGP